MKSCHLATPSCLHSTHVSNENLLRVIDRSDQHSFATNPSAAEMKLASLLSIALVATGTSLAAPEPEEVSMMAAGSTWTIHNFKRTCNKKIAPTLCNYSFSVIPHDGTGITKCHYKVSGTPASRAAYGPVKCGPYTISSTWSDVFGVKNGFQTLAVIRKKRIIYPAYTDKQLKAGKVVKPDQSYTPQKLP
jgi:hypothetical protein